MDSIAHPLESAHGGTLRDLFSSETLLACTAVVVCLGMIEPGWPTVVIVGVSVFLLSTFGLDGLLLGLILLLPVGPVLAANAPLRDIATGIRVLVFLGFLVRRLMRRQSLRSWLLAERFDYLVLGYLVVVVFTVVLSKHLSHNTGRSLFRLFSYVCMYFLITGWVGSRELRDRIIRVLLWSTVVVALFGIYQSITSGYSGLFDLLYPTSEPRVDWEGRVTSFLNYSNSLAGYLNLVLPLALVASITRVKEVPWRLALSTLVLGSVALFLTQSRGALVAFGGVLLLAGYYLSKRRGAFLLVAPTVVLIVWIGLPLMARYSQHFDEIEERTAISRLQLWAAAGNMYLSSPVVGVGYGNFRDLYAPMIDVDWIEAESYDAHNVYLQTLAETGVVGLAAFFFLLGAVVRRGRREVRHAKQPMCRVVGFAAVGAVAAVLLHGFVDYLFQVSPQFGSLFWIILGLLVVSTRLSKADDVHRVEPYAV